MVGGGLGHFCSPYTEKDGGLVCYFIPDHIQRDSNHNNRRWDLLDKTKCIHYLIWLLYTAAGQPNITGKPRSLA